MSKKKIEVEILPIGEIQFDENNPNFHPDENLELIQTSFEKNGAARSIVINKDNRLVAGEGSTKGATNAGIENVIVIDTDGKTLVAVRRKDLTPEQENELKIVDNQTTRLSEWQPENLLKILDGKSDEELQDFGFTLESLEHYKHHENLKSMDVEDFFVENNSSSGKEATHKPLIFNFTIGEAAQVEAILEGQGEDTPEKNLLKALKLL